MKIGVDARTLSKRRTGVGNCLYNTLKIMVAGNKDVQWYLYSNSKIDLSDIAGNNIHHRIGKGGLARIGTLWLQTQGLKMIKQDQLDVFWGIEGILPFGLPGSLKTVITIHDLVDKLFPSTMAGINMIIQKTWKSGSIKRADKIIANSNTTASDISIIYPHEANKIGVIYWGVNRSLFRPIDKNEAKAFVANKYGLTMDYILTVGTIEPRKNIEYLIKSYGQMLAENPGNRIELVICGGKGWKGTSVARAVNQIGHPGMVRFIGYIPDEDMPYLYSGAILFVMASLYEGFGLPVIEAIQSGVPVLLSDIPIFREVAEEEAYYFDLKDQNQLIKSMSDLCKGTDLGSELRNKREGVLDKYSWDITARNYLDSFYSLGR